MPQTVDYAALADQVRRDAAGAAPPTAPGPVDYAALADQVRQGARTPDFRSTAIVPSTAETAWAYSGIPQLLDVGAGALKGAAHTAVNLGRAVHAIPGVDALLGSIPADAETTLGLDPTTTAQRIGYGAEQAAEFLIPAGPAEAVATRVAAKVAPLVARTPAIVRTAATTIPRMVTQGVASGAVTAAQGGDVRTGAVLGAAVPVVGQVVAGAGRVIGSKAEPLVRAAVKPTVAALRRVAGASVEGLDAQANKLVRFIIDNKTTTAAQARQIVADAERELQRVLSGHQAPTDAPQRALRYLGALERSAAKQGLAASDVATLRNAAAEVLEGSLGTDVVTMVPQAHPTLVGPQGQPISVLVPQTTRALRTDVSASEALDSARASGLWRTRKAWGEQKGAQMEAAKAVERAARDALKVVAPDARPILARQGQAIRAAEALDAMEVRQANRDALSLPAHVIAAGEVASGRVPFLAFAANWLRNNQMKAGIMADQLAKAIARQDVKSTATILGRLMAGSQTQTRRPEYAR